MDRGRLKAAAGRFETARVAFLRGFAANRYIAPMLLGQRWSRLAARHWTNTTEPEWAEDYVDRGGHLWRDTPGGLVERLFWWSAERSVRGLPRSPRSRRDGEDPEETRH